jgi:hypothetical protein
MHLWDRLLPAQATITLNLRQSPRRNPKISVYQMLERNFDFNCTPIAPPGTRIILHEKQREQRKT